MSVGIIYKATCIENGKVYIGQTTEHILVRKKNHLNKAFGSKFYGTHFYNAIRKYGKDSFEWKIIHENIPINYLDNMEVLTISLYDSYENGYNSTEGGRVGHRGYKISEETRKKMSKSQLNKKEMSKETKKKMSEAHFGKHHSKDTRRKMSESATGHKKGMYGKKHTTETKQKMSKAATGKRFSEKHRKNLSLAIKRIFTEEFLKKISGENGNNAKLTWKEVKDIRFKYATGKYTQDKLSKIYNISCPSISKIINYKAWKIYNEV